MHQHVFQRGVAMPKIKGMTYVPMIDKSGKEVGGQWIPDWVLQNIQSPEAQAYLADHNLCYDSRIGKEVG